MKKLVALLIVSLMATSAFAVIDPDPDMVGIYFDTNADLLTFTGTNTFAYIMLTNTTYEEVSGFECTFDFVTPAGMEGMMFIITDFYGGLNIGSVDGLHGNLVIGWAEPRVTSPAFPLVKLTLILMAQMRVEGYLGAAEVPSIAGDLPVLEFGGGLTQLGLSTGGANIPVCIINPDAEDDVVPTEIESFGGVKALFR